LLPTFGGALWANAVDEKKITTRMNSGLIINSPFASTPRPLEADYKKFPQSIRALRAAPGSSKLIAY
jgi:hypothetical protein